MKPQDSQSIDEFFWNQVDVQPSDGCWTWKGGISSRGGPVFVFQGARLAVTALIATLVNSKRGDLSLNLLAPGRRKCSNKLCINPAHFQADRSTR